jgi:hypothetical protein
MPTDVQTMPAVPGWLATPVQSVAVFSTGGSLPCAPEGQDVSVCFRNPAPNATEPFESSPATTVSVKS